MGSTVDLLISNIGRLITCASPTGAKRGEALRDVGALVNAALAIDKGKIVALGEQKAILEKFSAEKTHDAQQKTIMPGFIDCHTHIVFGGNRVHEFEMRVKGATYMEIMAAGGGIVSTMRHTRGASVGELVATAAQRLDTMLALGSTTVEVKTGYGLDVATEIKMLQVIERLDQTHACRLVPTFLGAHTLPPEFKNDPEGYVSLVVDGMIPAAWSWYQASHFASEGTPFFIDVFCEDHAFTVEQTRRILAAGQRIGMQAKIHVDQFNSLGGLEMALDVGAVSADHLEVTTQAGIDKLVQTDTIGVLMPAVNFNLGLTNFAQGRAMVDAGASIALATDMNPGSAPCFSMPLTMAIGCRYLGLTPAEALNAATINAAYAIGLADQVGSLEVGKSADFIILNSNDYRNVTYLLGNNPIHQIYKNGEAVITH